MVELVYHFVLFPFSSPISKLPLFSVDTHIVLIYRLLKQNVLHGKV